MKARRLTNAERRAKRERARNRPRLVVLAAFHAGACAFLAFAVAASMTHPASTTNPDEYAAALALLVVMAIGAGVTAALCAWECR